MTFRLLETSELSQAAKIGGTPIQTSGVDDNGDLWLLANEVSDAYAMTRSNMAKHLQRNIPLGWKRYELIPTPKGERKALFINQYAVAKLAGLSRKPEAQHFADEVIQLGIRAKRGDIALALDIIDRQEPDAQRWLVQRVKTKLSFLARNAVVDEHTRDDAEASHTIKMLAAAVNRCTTGRTARQIQEQGGAKATRDNLAPHQLAFMEYMELSQAACIQLHDAEGKRQIGAAVDAFHEESEMHAKKVGMHRRDLLRDRTQGGKRKVPTVKEAQQRQLV